MRTICGTIIAAVCTMWTAFPAVLEALPVPNEDKAYGDLYGRIVERIRLWPGLAPHETESSPGRFAYDEKNKVWRCDFLAVPKAGSPKSAQLVEFKYFTNAAAEKGNVLGRAEPDAETVEQALAYRKALARRPDWNHPIAATVVEVCGNTGYNWFDLPESKPF